ncbi:hypothetical protein ACFE04_031429 [Oxalis oulophora]
MEALVNHNHSNNNNSNDDHVEELENFLATKSGVKGLVDSGIDQVPKFFIQQSQHLTSLSSSKQVPIVDLGGLENKQRRKQIVNEIREAAETWGFFQLINHEVPVTIIDDVLEGVRKFNEQPNEVKTEFYCSDGKTNRVRFFSNGTVNRSVAANWKDSLLCMFRDQQLDEQEIPQVCRQVITEYMKYVFELKDTLSELLSEALGLRSDYLANIEYNVGGLQVLHQNEWVDVPYLPGSLVANIADLMQVVTNNKFKSVVHRVLVGKVKSRVSTACFFFPSSRKFDSLYGPVKELLSENNQPIYQEVCASEYLTYYQAKGFGTTSTLLHFKLPR